MHNSHAQVSTNLIRLDLFHENSVQAAAWLTVTPHSLEHTNETGVAIEWVRTHVPSRQIGTNIYWIFGGDLSIPDRQLPLYVNNLLAAMEAGRRTVSITPAAPSSSSKRFSLLSKLHAKSILSYIMKYSTGLQGPSGNPIRWPNEQTYVSLCVDRWSFDSDHYSIVTNAISQAVRDWNKVTPLVQLRYLQEFDATTPVDLDGAPDGYDFIVVGESQPAVPENAIAQAFLPSVDPYDRKLRIFPFYFTQTTYNPVGVLRHELGHVLGLIHEHNRTEGCPVDLFSAGETLLKLTPTTDTKSVMHYLCAGQGDSTWNITSQDALGLRVLYATKPKTFLNTWNFPVDR